MVKPSYPCLWFDGQAQEAAAFYCSIFEQARIVSSNPMVVIFELNGMRYMGLNGGPHFTFNESISFVVECETQEEIDHYWCRLSEGGQESMCGWLKDKYGVSWQIVPSILASLIADPTKSAKVLATFSQTRKFQIDQLTAL
jgi:predicted 3-demethylubiquinone-9 3-methyltransferase (glyoxalase superfamily)